MKKSYHIIILLLSFVFLSCETPKNFNYMQDLYDGTTIQTSNNGMIRLQKGDEISIIVKSKIPEFNYLFNGNLNTNISSGSSSGNQYITGYTIDSDGNIDFPILGKIHLSGLTREETEEIIKEKLVNTGMAKDVTVNVGYKNLSYTVLGEVTLSGIKKITKDETNIFEALGQSGDVTLFGKRDSIVVLRDVDGMKKTYMLNLASGKDLLRSDAFYIHQNDVIYVKANNYRARQSTANGNTSRNVSVWLSVASVLTTIAVLFFK